MNNTVQILYTSRSPSAPYHASGGTLIDHVLVDRPEGKKYKYFYDPKSGAKAAPKLPITLREGEPFFDNNVAFFQLYREVYGAGEMQIIDNRAMLNEEAQKLELTTRALTYLSELNTGKQTEKMIQLIRQLDGPVAAGTTQKDLMVKLGRIAQETPSRILDAADDADFGVKAVVFKALDEGRIKQKDRFYYEADGKTLLADGLAELISKYRSDKNVKALLEASPKAVAPKAAKAKSAKIDELLAAGTPAVSTPILSAADPVFSDAKLTRLIEEAIKADYYLPEANGYRIDDGQVLSQEAILGWLKANPRQAQELESALTANGILKHPLAD